MQQDTSALVVFARVPRRGCTVTKKMTFADKVMDDFYMLKASVGGKEDRTTWLVKHLFASYSVFLSDFNLQTKLLNRP